MSCVASPKSTRAAGLAIGGPGSIRVGPLRAFAAVLAERGIRPQRALALAGIDPAAFDAPDNRITLDAGGRLMDVCATLTGWPHFGLLVGERFELKDFGPLGHLLRNCATVGDAVRALLMHLYFQDRGAAPILLAADPDCLLLGYSIHRYGYPSAAQIYDTAITVGHRLLAELCGPGWRARRVQFAHGRPASAAAYRRVFRTSVVFDADTSGIVFDSSWMRWPIAGADPALRDFLAAALDSAAGGAMSFAEKVQGILHQMVLSGTASAPAVAAQFGIGERTLRRRLEAESTSLQELVNRTRFELAQQLLANTRLSVAEIASALHYADPNVFSRAFRNWAGVSPSQWRDRG